MKSISTQISLIVGLSCAVCFQAHSQTLTGAGATFPYPLYSKWFDTYQRATGVRINYQAIGSGGGIQQLKNGSVDFAASDRPLLDAEAQAMPLPVVHLPTVGGAVAVVYNLPELNKQKKQLRLSGRVLSGIYLGTIRRWNDRKIAAINPGTILPNAFIRVHNRFDGSGTTHVFTNYLSALSEEWRRQAGAGRNVQWPTGKSPKSGIGIHEIFREFRYSIGYVELAYVVQNRMQYAAIQNRAGQFISPSVAGVEAAISNSSRKLRRNLHVPIVNAPGADVYPISGLTYILLTRKNNDQIKRNAVLRFLNWTMTVGRRYIKPILYAPLPPTLVQHNQTTLRSLK